LSSLGAFLALASGLTIRLAGRVDGGADLLLLLAYHFFAAVDPLVHGVARFAAAVLQVLGTFLCAAFDVLAGFTPRTRRIQNPHQRAKAKSCQEPHEAVAAISVRHQKTSTIQRC